MRRALFVFSVLAVWVGWIFPAHAIRVAKSLDLR